jgi:hypothetical protein
MVEEAKIKKRQTCDDELQCLGDLLNVGDNELTEA